MMVVPKISSVPFIVFGTLSLLPTACEAFQIGQLLSTCIEACERGCHEVRRVEQTLERGKGSVIDADLKDSQDPRSAVTQADIASQHAIVQSLRETWGDSLRIVGEEEDEQDDDSDKTYEPLSKSLLDDDIGETADIPAKDITVFVDPLDGTREFVEGRLENCQVLVGIAIQGEPVAGAVGMPFPNHGAASEDGKTDDEATIVYGLADIGTGVRGAALTRGPFPLERNIDGVKFPRPHHATGDNPVEVIENASNSIIHTFAGSRVTYGGAGNKILATALGEVSCSIQHRVGGPWDLCAPVAIARAMGAQITDLFGQEIEICKLDEQGNPPPRCNERGFCVSAPSHDHRGIVQAILASPKVQEYKAEIMGAVAAETKA